MPLRVKCPTGHTLIVPDDRAGRTLRCPRCEASVVVPGEAGPSVADSGQRVEDRQHRTDDREQRTADSGERRAESGQTTEECAGAVGGSASFVAPVSDVPVNSFLAVAEPVAESVIESVAVSESAVEPATAAGPAVVAAPPQTIELAVSPPIAATAPPHESPVAPVQHAPPPAAPGMFDFLDSREAADTFVPPPIARPTVASSQLHADASRTLGVYQLAAALVAAALLSVAPAVWDIVEYLRAEELDTPFVARWALVLLFLGIVQLAYAVYLFQLPDWSSVWVVTVMLLLLAAAYACVLGMVLTSDANGFLVGPQGLQLADKLAGGKAALWCLCMVSLTTILAFFAGRMSVQWRRAEKIMRLAGF